MMQLFVHRKGLMIHYGSKVSNTLKAGVLLSVFAMLQSYPLIVH